MADVLHVFFRNFNSRIEEPVRHHLRNVYACLTMSAISAAIGAYVHVLTDSVSGVFLSTLAGFGLLIALLVTPYDGKNMALRLSYLLGFAFCCGMGLGPLIQYVIHVKASLILSALIGTTFIFACFTLSALFSKRGYWLFLFAPLSALFSIQLGLMILNIFFGSYWIYQIKIYLGLLAMCGFVIFDTTLIMEKFRMGDKDFISHAVVLFVDFIGLFKRILMLLAEKERSDRERKRN